MSIMDNIKNRLQSWLEISAPYPQAITLQEDADYNTTATINRIWYRGKAGELDQLYSQLQVWPVEQQRFWASRPTPGIEIRKVHTGLPGILVDLLAGIVVSNINDIEIDKSSEVRDVWAKIAAENSEKKLLEKAVKETLVVGDGAFKISIDPEVSQYPIIEFWAGDRIDYTTKRGRIQEIIFKSFYKSGSATLELDEVYGKGFIDYYLYRNGEPVELTIDDRFKDLVRVEWDDKTMLAVPLQFYSSSVFEGRGQSILDKKTDAFDSLDEAYSQWIDALRAGRTKEYIPESLLPRDPRTGAVLKPNAFDNRYIQTDADMKERASNAITTQSATIQHDSYQATYITALDLCLQGVMSPSTLGIDVKKLDNAESQREKEKVTLYTRSAIIEALQPALEDLIRAAVEAWYLSQEQTTPEYTATVSFQNYANPSFESQIETVGKGRAQGIMSIEASVEELYGDDKDDDWKKQEIARLKAEQGLAEMQEPMIGEDVWNDYSSNRQTTLPLQSGESGGSAE